MNVIGIGGVGSRVARFFETYGQYKTFYVDHEAHGSQTFMVPKKNHPEDYESQTYDWSDLIENLDEEPVFLFVSGGSYLSAITLSLAQNLLNKEVIIVYIKPDTSMLNATRQMNEKVVYNVLQHYVRSGKMSRIYLFDNQEIEKTLGDVPVIGYWDRINHVIAYTIHMINVFSNNKPVMGSLEDPRETCRITAVGSKNLVNGEEKMFFPLANPRELCYIYAINEENLKKSNKLHSSIKEDLKAKIVDDLTVSFGIFPTKYDSDFAYVVKHTSFVQDSQQ